MSVRVTLARRLPYLPTQNCEVRAKLFSLLMFLAKQEKVLSRGRACPMEKQTVASSGHDHFSPFVSQGKAVPIAGS